MNTKTLRLSSLCEKMVLNVFRLGGNKHECAKDTLSSECILTGTIWLKWVEICILVDPVFLYEDLLLRICSLMNFSFKHIRQINTQSRVL